MNNRFSGREEIERYLQDDTEEKIRAGKYDHQSVTVYHANNIDQWGYPYWSQRLKYNYLCFFNGGGGHKAIYFLKSDAEQRKKAVDEFKKMGIKEEQLDELSYTEYVQLIREGAK